jgi:hypothetical protein
MLYIEYLVFDCKYSDDVAKSTWVKLYSKVNDQLKTNVIWGRNGAKHHAKKTKTLFIWDESHYAQDIGMSPDKFLETMGILPNGDFRCLEEMDNYVLSVSATPFSELCDIQNYSQGKTVIPLVPSEGYWGVEQMSKRGAIIRYTDII